MSPIDTQQESTPKGAGDHETDKDFQDLTVFGSATKAIASVNRSPQNSMEREEIHEVDGKDPG